jgi:hypothetical protein
MGWSGVAGMDASVSPSDHVSEEAELAAIVASALARADQLGLNVIAAHLSHVIDLLGDTD